MKEKYNVDWFSQSGEWKRNRMTNPDKYDDFMQFDADPASYIKSTFPDRKPSLIELCESVGVGGEAVGLRLQRADCVDMVDYVLSTMEREVCDAIHSIDSDIHIVKNTKHVITPYELDIYLPDFNFAIECNPTSTHNSSVNTFDRDDEPTPIGYHKMKTDMCEERGIFLFHIFGYDWTHRREVILSMIRNYLHRNSETIYARNTKLQMVSDSEAAKFLNDNHRQGYANASVRLGLLYNNEMVSLMTFGRMRSTIGTTVDDNRGWELVRFCSKQNTSVVGSASKLFKFFIDNYSPERIISFSDRAHTQGNLYSTLGFKDIRHSDPGYMWVDSRTDKAYHRVNAQKHNLKKFLADDTIDLSQTEKQLMESHGYLQVFDSGTITWEWRRAE